MPKKTEITLEQIERLRHTLGDETCYRNHFCADEGHTDLPDLEKLVEKGLMTKRAGRDWQGGGYVFHVTEEGKKYAFPQN